MEAIVGALAAVQLDWATLSAFVAMLLQPDFIFIFLFVFRYLRLVVHIISYCLYQPSPVPASGSMTEKQCTVIIPTVDPGNPLFHECLSSILTNDPLEIRIVTVGKGLQKLTKRLVKPYQAAFPSIPIIVSATDVANKRKQITHAIPLVQGKITMLVDETVIWPSPNFLRTAIAPFEDSRVGGVGTNKRVRRENLGFGLRSFWNMMGALYLERHNFEIRATNAIDGGVFVISGRTCAYRTEILQDPSFLAGYTNERFFFGLCGPLNADDDNFITRWLVSHGWKIKIQYCQDAMIETVLGSYPRFLAQCLRWSRTTWRSNTASLFTDRTVYRAQPWCVYAVYLTSLVNFALFYDAALVYTLTRTTFYSSAALLRLGMCIFFSKLVKLLPYFCRHPADLVYLPGYFAFAYFHTFIKLYAGLTFWVTTWGGRDLAAVNFCPEHIAYGEYSYDDDDDDDDDDGDDTLSYLPSSMDGSSLSGWPDTRHPDDQSGRWSGKEEPLQSSTPGTGTHHSTSHLSGTADTAPASAQASVPVGSSSAWIPPPGGTTTPLHGFRSRHRNQVPVRTPWGVITPRKYNPYSSTPANVLMDQHPRTTWPRTWTMTTRQSHGEYRAPIQSESPVGEAKQIEYTGGRIESESPVEATKQQQQQLRDCTPLDSIEQGSRGSQQQLPTPRRSPRRILTPKRIRNRNGTPVSPYCAWDNIFDDTDNVFKHPDADIPLPSIETSPTSSAVARDRQLGVFVDDSSRTGLDFDFTIDSSTTDYETETIGRRAGLGLATPPSSPPTSLSLTLEPPPVTPPQPLRGRWNGYTRTWVRASSPGSCNRLHWDGSDLVRPGHCALQDGRFQY